MHIVIIGNGAAANSACKTVRRLDNQAAITMIAEEDLPYYSPCVLPDYLAGRIVRYKVFLKTQEDYARANVRTVFGRRVTELDVVGRNVVWDGGSVQYDKLIIATGSTPIIPPFGSTVTEGTFTLKWLEDADAIFHHEGQRAVVVGSGPIGVQASIALRQRGCQVVIVESLDHILPRAFADRPASLLKAALEAQGIEVVVGERVIGVLGKKKVEGVCTESREVRCDTVILALGVRPNADLARRAGLRLGALGGIAANEYMTTTMQNVYACGDCTEARDLVTGQNTLSPLWHNAKQQGEVAAFNSLGIPKAYPGSLNLVGLELFGTYAVSLGVVEASQQGFDIIEKASVNSYSRVVMRDGSVVGMQLVGHARPLGGILNAIRRKDNLLQFKGIAESRPLLLHEWLKGRVANYLNW
jgi:NADH oxidase (H2O2-forming)